MATTTNQKLADLHQTAMAQFDTIQATCRDERRQCLEDRRFYSIAGAQWEGALGDQFANKPKFEINKIHLAVIKIFSEYRNNRIDVQFSARGDDVEDPELPDRCARIYRADEKGSGAQEAYDNAFEEAVGGGIGAWRLRAKYENDEDFNIDDAAAEYQRVSIEPIHDADMSVFFDLDAKRQDKADAQHCFVLSALTPEKYEAEYGDAPASMPREAQNQLFDWFAPDVVYIAEYFVVEFTKKSFQVWQTLGGEETRYAQTEFDESEDLESRLLAEGSTFVRTVKRKVRRVRKYIIDGARVLEDCGYIAGKNIPIVPVYGKRWYVDNIERVMGHVRLAKDTQRVKNMQTSKLGEISALSSVEKPIFTPEQMAGHEVLWSEDAIKNYNYMLVNPITDLNGNLIPSGPIGYTKPPALPPALAALLQITDADMKDLLGNEQAPEQIQQNTSGVAVELLQNKFDMLRFIYLDNMAKAMQRSGEIWLSMASDVYVEEGRKLDSMLANGKVERITLANPVVDKKTGRKYLENDLSQAKMSVDVVVGPLSASKKASVARSLINILGVTEDPESKQVLGAMLVLNMEGEGMQEVHAYFRNKLLRMGAIKPSDAEAAQLAQEQASQQPDANTEYLKAAAEEASANAVKARADTIHVITKAEESKAKAMKLVSEVDSTEQQQALEIIDRFSTSPQQQLQAPEITPAPSAELDVAEQPSVPAAEAMVRDESIPEVPT